MIIQRLFTVTCCLKIVCMMADTSRKATCVKAQTLALPSDHMLNDASKQCHVWCGNGTCLFIDKNQTFRTILAYILYHYWDNNYIENSGKWQKLHIWTTHFWTMISTVTNCSQWILIFKYIPQHLFINFNLGGGGGERHLTLMACLWYTFCSWNYNLLSYSNPDPFQLTGKLIWGMQLVKNNKKLVISTFTL